MTELLAVSHLYKKYPSFELSDVSFSLQAGHIVGFIGRNGAGKTTTLKCIYNLVKPNSGEVLYMGHPLADNEIQAKQDIGLLFGGFSYYPNMSLKAISDVTSRFYKQWDQAQFLKWCSYFELDLNKKVKELSSGMKVKFGLSLALSHNAKILLLDEPTSGLDPVSRDELLDCFMKIASKQEKTILFSTHVISDLERCADDIVYIQKGKIISDGSVASFKSSYLHVEGEEKDLSSSMRELVGHLLVKEGKYSGVIHSEDKDRFESASLSKAGLEEIMIFLERGHEDEESPF